MIDRVINNGNLSYLKRKAEGDKPQKTYAQRVLPKSTSVRFGSDDPGVMDEDNKRFWDIVGGNSTPDHLLDQIARGRVKIGKDGSVSFPMPSINRPNFNYGPNNDGDGKGDGEGEGQGQGNGGVGSSPGKGTGDVIGEEEGEGEGGKKGGQGEGQYDRENWGQTRTGSEIAKLLGRDLGLPFLKDKGRGSLTSDSIGWDHKKQPPPGRPLRESYEKPIAREMYDVQMGQEKLIQDLFSVAYKREPNEDELDHWRDAVKEIAEDKPETAAQEILTKFFFSREYQSQFAAQPGKMVQDVAEIATGKQLLPRRATFWTDKLKAGMSVKEFVHGFYNSVEAQPLIASNKRKLVFNPDDIMVGASDIRRVDWKVKQNPHSRAVIFYVMDVSGSISDEDKEMARTNNFFLSSWIKYQYGMLVAKNQGKSYNDKDFFGKGVEERFVIHTDGAKEVSQDEFYTTRQSGGTTISSALKLVQEMIEKKYNPKDWNVYIFQYSDGDSWGDNDKSTAIIDDLMAKGVNMLGYCHLGSAGYGYGMGADSGNFRNVLEDKYSGNNRIRTAILDTPAVSTYKKAIKKLLEKEKEGVKK